MKMDILLYLSQIANSKTKTEEVRAPPVRRQFGYEVDYEDLEAELSEDEADEPSSETRLPKTPKIPERFCGSNPDPESVETVFANALNVA